ncbi:MAG: hypothetical protein D8M59_16060 [Planctomycetes bacterium]|nr:hypothetical protein [Planctomycetota bacterium]NOG54036.1 hypothetical protein [Planctomycetota bacterium]
MNMCDQYDNPKTEESGESPAGQVVSARMITTLVAFVALAVASGSFSAADAVDYRDMRVVETVLHTLRTSSGQAGRSHHDSSARPGQRAMRKAISRLASAAGFLSCDGSALSRQLLSHAQRVLEAGDLAMPAFSQDRRLSARQSNLPAFRRQVGGIFFGNGPGPLAEGLARLLNLPPPC